MSQLPPPATPKSSGTPGAPGASGTTTVVVPVMPTPKWEATADDRADEKAALLPRQGDGGHHSDGAPPIVVVNRLWTLLRSLKPQHVRDFGQMMDPLALLLIFIFCFSTGCVGIWQLATAGAVGSGNVAVSFILNSPISGSPFLIIATLWAFFNSVPPYRECEKK